MNIKKILLICGTRPELIKLAPLYICLKKYPNRFKVSLCVTGQHKQMLKQALDIFQIKPDFDLKIMKPNQSHFSVTSKILIKMEDVLKSVKPDVVIVHGDTTTTLAASLSCYYLKIKLAHVEAGLRTNEIYSPYPEELNRQVVSRIANFHFAPTKQSKKNLIKENINKKNILVTGNTVIDSLKKTISLISSNKIIHNKLATYFNKSLGFEILDEKYILITVHRTENFGNGLKKICIAINHLSRKYKNLKFILPVHMNPKVANSLQKMLKNKDNIFLIKPQDYLHFLYLLKYCYLVLTDSGGIQEEAPSLDKPVLVMRDSTERPEGVKAGTIKVIGATTISIIKNVSLLLNDEKMYKRMSKSKNPYGDGNASEKIVKFLSEIK
tara:strand:- start:2534 stop:3679 length:1146 start_codon:yes stop_codon:yes gene_type:complete